MANAIGCIGLENTENLCWANSVIQLLTPDPEFWTEDDASKGGVFEYLYMIQGKKWGTRQQYVPSLATREAIQRTYAPGNQTAVIDMNLHVQQDAHEFMVKVLDMCDSQCTQGRIERTTTCDVCGHMSVHETTFRQLDVRNLAQIASESHQMNRFIQSQIATEHLVGDNAWECDKCCAAAGDPGVRQPATTRFRVLKWPVYLVINVARFIHLDKDTTPFDFPTLWQGRKETDPKYKLMTMIVHVGSQARGGHYIAFGRVGKGWQLYDDAASHRIGLKHVTCIGNQRNCYQLLYKLQ